MKFQVIQSQTNLVNVKWMNVVKWPHKLSVVIFISKDAENMIINKLQTAKSNFDF